MSINCALPNDILNIILYNYLSIDDVRVCLASGIFNVLYDYQKEIVKNAMRGEIYCAKMVI